MGWGGVGIYSELKDLGLTFEVALSALSSSNKTVWLIVSYVSKRLECGGTMSVCLEQRWHDQGVVKGGDLIFRMSC